MTFALCCLSLGVLSDDTLYVLLLLSILSSLFYIRINYIFLPGTVFCIFFLFMLEIKRISKSELLNRNIWFEYRYIGRYYDGSIWIHL